MEIIWKIKKISQAKATVRVNIRKIWKTKTHWAKSKALFSKKNRMDKCRILIKMNQKSQKKVKIDLVNNLHLFVSWWLKFVF